MADAKASLQHPTDAVRVARIRAVVIEAGAQLRRRHPLLRHQDAIGATTLLLSLAGMAASGWWYATGQLGWWWSIPLTALCASLIHELEHDLIHTLYFRRIPALRHLMLALGWLARPSTVNPWIRRELHLNHHKHSGTMKDIEERAITNGEPWGFARLVMTGDNIMAIVLRLHRAPNGRLRARMLLRGLAAYFPLGWLHWGLWYVFVAFHALDGFLALALGGHPAWSPGTLATMQWVDLLAVVLVAPNVLRTFCLHFVSSNMHYFGDVADGNLMQQTQVLNPWWLAPFQLFCFNFGATHAIHHFVVGEPFYIRQLTARAAHQVMRSQGVRFNDLGSFLRANRYRCAPQEDTLLAEEAVES